MRVYVAASSAQLDRAKAVMGALRARGHSITHDWVTEVERVGSANPVDASEADRVGWASDDLFGVAHAEVFWLLMPTENGFGAAVELGAAITGRSWDGKEPRIIVSGGSPERSIFTSLADAIYDRDDIAFETEFMHAK